MKRGINLIRALHSFSIHWKDDSPFHPTGSLRNAAIVTLSNGCTLWILTSTSKVGEWGWSHFSLEVPDYGSTILNLFLKYFITNLSNNDMTNIHSWGKLSLMVCIVTLNHVIEGLWFFGYNKLFSSTLRLC